MTDLERIQTRGYAVLEGLLSPAELARIAEELEPHFGAEGWGRNDFEGRRTERVYSLLAKCPSVAPLVEHPRVLALLDEFLRPSRLLAACQATRIHPGETAQALHADDEVGAPPRPRDANAVSVMWALSPYTADNGATRLVPGSHAWKHDDRPDAGEAIPVLMEPGSALVYLGSVYHGGGAHASDACRTGISIIYFQPWLRQIENMTLAVPPDVASRYSETVQRMLGYDVIDGLFYGHVDGRDPIKLVPGSAEHRTRKRVAFPED